jgi:seryl-tRNA synthetase
MEIMGMKTLRIEVEIPEDLRRDVEQGVYYCSASIVASRVDRERGSSIEIDLLDEADPASLEQTVRSWIERTVRSSLRYEATTVREWGGHDGFVATTEEVLGSPEIHGLGEGLVAYGPKLTRALRAIRGLCESLSEGVGADPFTLPAVATLEHLHRCDYLRQFPQLLSFVTHFREDFGAIDAYSLQCRNAQVADECVPPTDGTRPVQRVLRPAICYHVYACFDGGTVPEKRPFIACADGDCFRYESRNTTGLDRLFDFRMYEIVAMGSEAGVRALRERMIEEVSGLLERLRLPGRVKSSNDPFFVSGSVMMSTFQRARDLKYELEVPFPNREGHLAVASFNLHQDFFASRFAIRTDDGAVAHTGCTAFGLDRILAAMLVHHGPDPAGWPASSREMLRLPD